jgi:hypothetical protein
MIAELFTKGGPMMYAVLAGAIVALGMNAVLAAVLAFRKRVPAPVFLWMPWCTALLGAAGWAMGLYQLTQAVPHASLQMRDSLTFSGLSIAPLPMWLALVCCAVVLALTAAAAGLTATIGAGKGAKWRFGGPIATLGLGALGVLGTAGWAVVSRHGPGPLLLPVILLIAGTGVVLVGLRMGEEDKDARRCAAARAFVGACAVMAVGCALMAVRMRGLMVAQDALASAAPESLQAMMAAGLFMARDGTRIGMAALAVVFVAHLIPALGARQHLFKTYTLVSGSLSGLALLFPIAMVLAVGWWSGTIIDGSMMFRAVEIAGQVPGLPGPAETYSESRVSHFETVITYSGGRWSREDQPLDRIDHWDPTYVALLATPATTPAQSLLETENLTAGGQPLSPFIQILIRRPPFIDHPDSPYFHWGHLGVVTFEHLTLSRQVADGVTGATPGAALEPEPLEGPQPPPEESLYVFDGSAAGGGDAWGVAEHSRDTWVSIRGGQARAIGQGEDAARMLRSIAEEHRPSTILFVPGEQWTVQDLVYLWMYATDEAQYSWDEWTVRCVLDAAAPAPQ